MSNIQEHEFLPGFSRSEMASLKGARTLSKVTFNPNTVSPGEELYIEIPKLSPSVALVPGSLQLNFKFKNKNTKSWFRNNLAALLVRRLRVKLAGETVYDCSREDLIQTYKDLWLTNTQRDNMAKYGIASENVRKLLSGDDSADAAANGGSDKELADTFQKLSLHVNWILKDHGMYAPYAMNNNFQYILTINNAEDVMLAQGGEKVDGFTLTDLELQYETIENSGVADAVTETYTIGRSLSFTHITLMKSVRFLKSETLKNLTINIPRKSMKAIILLFKDDTELDAENFLNPKIEKVKVTFEGIPNYLFSQGMTPELFFSEAKRFLCPHVGAEKLGEHINQQDFITKHNFSLVLDFRTTEENTLSGNGLKVVNTQSGIILEISKKVNTNDSICYIYVVSDGVVNFINRDLDKIHF